MIQCIHRKNIYYKTSLYLVHLVYHNIQFARTCDYLNPWPSNLKNFIYVPTLRGQVVHKFINKSYVYFMNILCFSNKIPITSNNLAQCCYKCTTSTLKSVLVLSSDINCIHYQRFPSNTFMVSFQTVEVSIVCFYYLMGLQEIQIMRFHITACDAWLVLY